MSTEEQISVLPGRSSRGLGFVGTETGSCRRSQTMTYCSLISFIGTGQHFLVKEEDCGSLLPLPSVPPPVQLIWTGQQTQHISVCQSVLLQISCQTSDQSGATQSYQHVHQILKMFHLACSKSPSSGELISMPSKQF